MFSSVSVTCSVSRKLYDVCKNHISVHQKYRPVIKFIKNMELAQIQTTPTSVSVSNAPTDIDMFDMEDMDPEIAAEIMEDWDRNKEKVEKYKKSKQNICDTETNPALIQVEKLLYPTLRNFLIKLLHKALENGCCHRPLTCFDGLDFLSESLYNSNPKDPTRMSPWKYIFDLNWIVEYLQVNPRPYFPLSLLMTRATAARYIQAHMRGFWVRRRRDLHEIRTFWKGARELQSWISMIIMDHSTLNRTIYKKYLSKNVKFKRNSTSRLSIVVISEGVKKTSKGKVVK